MTLGLRSDQLSLFGPDPFLTRRVRSESFYGFLARCRGELFHDDEFAALYTLDNGRPSVPPSLLALALILQTHDRVSDDEAKARADFDLRWKVALGLELDSRPFAKSTLQLFRSQLILHKRVRAVFKKSLAFARESGYLKHRKLKAALDTSNILGRGAVKDTYNLLGDGIVKLAWRCHRPILVQPEFTAGHEPSDPRRLSPFRNRRRQRFLSLTPSVMGIRRGMICPDATQGGPQCAGQESNLQALTGTTTSK